MEVHLTLSEVKGIKSSEHARFIAGRIDATIPQKMPHFQSVLRVYEPRGGFGTGPTQSKLNTDMDSRPDLVKILLKCLYIFLGLISQDLKY